MALGARHRTQNGAVTMGKKLTRGAFPGRPLIAVAVSRAGFHKGTRCLGFAACWMIAARKHGRSMTVDEYGEFWLQSRAQSFREQQLWRQVFPEFATPFDLWEACGASVPSTDDQAEVVAECAALRLPVAA